MFGLAEDVDMSLEGPPMPRDMNIHLKVNNDDNSDDRGWKLERTLRPQNYASLRDGILN